MGPFELFAHWRRAQQVKRFERYIQKAMALYRYDPKPILKQRGVTIVNARGQGAILSYCPKTQKLYYFSHEQVDPALICVAETMLVIYLETLDNPTDKSYIVTMRDVTELEGPRDNVVWFHYMDALDRLMPVPAMQAIRKEIVAMDKLQHLSYAYCRIFHLPMAIVRTRYKDTSLGIHHQTSFTGALILLKDKLSHDPRLERPDHQAPSPQRRKYRDRPR
jgi:hypothetical protein